MPAAHGKDPGSRGSPCRRRGACAAPTWTACREGGGGKGVPAAPAARWPRKPSGSGRGSRVCQRPPNRGLPQLRAQAAREGSAVPGVAPRAGHWQRGRCSIFRGNLPRAPENVRRGLPATGSRKRGKDAACAAGGVHPEGRRSRSSSSRKPPGWPCRLTLATRPRQGDLSLDEGPRQPRKVPERAGGSAGADTATPPPLAGDRRVLLGPVLGERGLQAPGGPRGLCGAPGGACSALVPRLPYSASCLQLSPPGGPRARRLARAPPGRPRQEGEARRPWRWPRFWTHARSRGPSALSNVRRKESG